MPARQTSDQDLFVLAKLFGVKTLSDDVCAFLRQQSPRYSREPSALTSALRRQRVVDLKLGYSCNDRCIHCIVDCFREELREREKPFDRTTAEYKALLSDYRARGFQTVVITGGEPSLRRDFVELLHFAWGIGLRCEIQSNGRHFSDDSLSRRLDFGQNDIAFTIALHGPTSAVHDAVTQVPGSHWQTVAGIRALVDRGYRVAGKMVLSRVNVAEIAPTIDALIGLGVYRGNIAFPRAAGPVLERYDEIVPRYEEVAPHVQDAIALQRTLPQPVFFDFEMLPPCFLAGKEQYCAELDCFAPDDTILDAHEGVTDQWTPLRQQRRQKFSQCADCRYDDFCEGVWDEYPERRGHDEFRPVGGARWTRTHWQAAIDLRTRLADAAYRRYRHQRHVLGVDERPSGFRLG